MSNPYLQKFEAVGKNREAVYAAIYDRSHVGNEAMSRPPSKRRQKRIRLYKSIIGKGHEAILEVGCGPGDLTMELAESARRVVGIDVSGSVIELARTRLANVFPAAPDSREVEFHCMGATNLKYGDGIFDWVVSTSLLEHLHPDDIKPHLAETLRVLKPRGRYLVWAPNRLGRHEHRDFHLSMLSYRELVGEMQSAGFRRFHTTPFNLGLLVNATFKVFLESWLSAFRIKTFWSHLGIRNLLVVAEK